MIGFKYFFITIHKDDNYDPIVPVSLYSTYRNNGIYRKSKSYRAVASTPNQRKKMISHIKSLIIKDEYTNGGSRSDYDAGTLAYYLTYESKQQYLFFLERYVRSVKDIGDEYKYVTSRSNKVQYLLDKLKGVHENFFEFMAPEDIMF